MRKLVPVILLALLAASCSSSDGTSADATDTSGAVESDVDTSPAMDDPILDAVTVLPPISEDGDPVVTIDGELSTDKTVRRVLTEGEGEVAEQGSTVTIHVMLINGRTGERFDGTRPGEPATVSLDPSSVLVGIFRSLVGVPAGSQVVSAVSPDEGVGAQGGFPDLGVEADDTIVFVFDVIDVTVPLERATGTAVEPPAGLPTVTLADDGAPSIELPDGDPPTELIGQVLIEGDGAVVEQGQSLTVHYTGIIWPGGEQFDSSWDRGEPAAFDIGVGAVIPGWDETLVGQTVGSQLILVIPPEQGYGSEGNANAGISGTDTLVFVVDILAAT
ncbi:MAG TPA: FKBP-type peptidyl-prolyl cis-trans isomerase [Acidimicrobiales bacterium]|nr:FKBP-type peptidyl-prolyl cis-trans isomerase [Acidimicrobiales bacterium]